MVVFDIFFKITLSQKYLQEICSPLQGKMKFIWTIC